jgi:alpha-galactosidase
MDVLFFEQDDIVCMGMLPSGMQAVLDHRDNVDGSIASRSICQTLDISFKAFNPESMLQVKFAGDAYFGHSGAGSDMRNATTCTCFKLQSQRNDGNSFVSEFATEDGIKATQKLLYKDGTEYIECQSSLYNGSQRTIRVEMFSSFSLGMISLLHDDDAPDVLKLHRFATFWSSEARHLEDSFEDLGMDMSWQAGGVRCLRFGQRSSSVAKEYAPFAAVEDTANGVVWAAAVEALTPWQMEVSRYSDFVNISGGLPDREFAGWFVDLKPGETLTAPAAIMTVCKGTFARAARNLLAYQRTFEPNARPLPVFSDWCTSWGKIKEERLLKVAEVAASLGVTHFSVDAGWFRGDAPGEWELDKKVFPHSFKHFSDEISKRFGLKSGIWFEFETVTPPNLENFQHKEQLLTLDGNIIISGERRFWDFRQPETITHLTHKVADFLKENHVGYLKVDYNAPIPFGTDGALASPAANLQEVLNCAADFHRRLRQLVPGLRIEECASGGTRMTPGWIRMGDYLSCSDAHEGVEIPILAADAMLLCDYDKALVWTTLRPTDDESRLSYSMCAGLLGQMQLSGDLDLLNEVQLGFVRKFTDFYTGISVPLRRGELTIQRMTKNRTCPKGTQVVMLETEDEALVVVHFFDTQETSISIELPSDNWQIADFASISQAKNCICRHTLQLSGMEQFSAAAIRLKR